MEDERDGPNGIYICRHFRPMATICFDFLFFDLSNKTMNNERRKKKTLIDNIRKRSIWYKQIRK